jgi:hypothetical protein
MTLGICARVTADAHRTAADRVGGVIGERDRRAMDRQQPNVPTAENAVDVHFCRAAPTGFEPVSLP